MVDRTSFPASPGAICAGCGTQYRGSPVECAICLDERQYVPWAGQQWTSSAELRENHEILFEDSSGVLTMYLDPSFAIGQRSFLIPQSDGLVMWECLSTVTDAALDRIGAMGGVKAIAISHPHFHAAMNEWSEALGDVPVWLHEGDREWVQNLGSNVQFWSGERHSLSSDLEIVHLPGHFPGSAGLWWKSGPRGGGSLFPGDAIQVVMDRRYATFMYSFPNAIPLGPSSVEGLEERVAPLAFDDLYGFSRGREMIGGAKERVAASFARYRMAIAA